MYYLKAVWHDSWGKFIINNNLPLKTFSSRVHVPKKSISRGIHPIKASADTQNKT